MISFGLCGDILCGVGDVLCGDDDILCGDGDVLGDVEC